MKYEVEQKFHVGDISSLDALIDQLGGKRAGEVEQIDTYFRHPSRDFEKTDEALRIRRVAGDCCITYKGPKIDAATKTRREIELPLPQGSETYDRFCELLESLGFRRLADVRKRRTKTLLPWQGNEVELSFDEVVNVGTFVELELQADESTLESAKRSIAELAKRLQLTRNERRSYLELMLQGESRSE